MNVIDSSGWLEYFGNGTNADVFAPVIKNTGELVVPTTSIYEVFKKVSEQRGDEEALKAVAIMSLGSVVDLTREIALSAAVASLELKLPMAGSIILASARSFDAELWTQDEHFSGIDRVNYFPKK
jgi:predicted nucleic acid-binding protein